MKVVLFCGGLGTRLRAESGTVPKPMVNIGYRPIIWHLMKYYAHFGHKHFILCLGHKGDVIKEYFRNYDECISNDFELSDGGKRVDLFQSDIQDWRITFVETGVRSNLGQRLQAVREHVENDEMFLANYSDGLSDLPLDRYLDWYRETGSDASLLAVRPAQSFHYVKIDDGSRVASIRGAAQADLRINGGFFAFRPSIFDFMRPDEELVGEPFQRMIEAGRLSAYAYDGFWSAMDTYKDKKRFDEMYESGARPWEVWNGDHA